MVSSLNAFWQVCNLHALLSLLANRFRKCHYMLLTLVTYEGVLCFVEKLNNLTVYSLYLQKEALLCSSCSKNTCKTDGGIRNPTDDEERESAHGSFTKVEIFEPGMKGLDTVQLQHILKDLYFPYIQI